MPRAAKSQALADDRAERGEGTWRERPDGLLEFRFYLDGKRRSVYGRSKAACRKQRAQLEKAHFEGAVAEGGRTRLKAWLRHWLRVAVQGKKRQNTINGYTNNVEKHIVPHLGHLKLADLRPHHVERWLADMADDGLSDRTRQYAHTVLRAALRHAMNQGIIGHNPAARVASVKLDDPEVHPLTRQQVAALLAAVKGTPDEAFYHVALTFGMRQGELLGLRWADLELDGPKPTIAIRYQAQFGDLAQLKRRRDQTVWPIPSHVVQLLESHKEEQVKRAKRAATRWHVMGLVFPSNVGTVKSRHNLTREWKALLKRAGLPETTHFHDLRHTAATIRLQRGEPLWKVSKLLGHGSTAITARIYAHYLPGEDTDGDPLEGLYQASS